jgi:ring-1,2-phenylacetyl-CoA epoxidase subunit PaaD
VVKRAALSRDELFAVLETVMDPEVPVLSVVDLGIVRDVESTDAGVRVTITPTYSGCPAMREIEQQIRSALDEQGVGPVEVRTTYLPAWTTDLISARGREKLEAYGIAPPGKAHQEALVTLRRRSELLRCPYCKSLNTVEKSEFGSTACKSIWFCNACRQPFEHFKAI